MSYKIAVGTSDSINVNLKFGELTEFYVYEVDGESYHLHEIRKIEESEPNAESIPKGKCSGGHCGKSGGCGGSEGIESRVSLISDCRCLVCSKVGFQAQKQLERKALSYFDVECTIDEAFGKIIAYYTKIDERKKIKK